MQNYKDTNGNIHFLSDEDIANGGEILLPFGCIEISQEEADSISSDFIKNIPDPVIIDPLTKLKDFLARNPDVDALLK